MKLCPKCSAVSDGTSRFCIECGTELGATSADPLLGRVFGGTFVIKELIGVGGMGRVYRGEQNTLGRTVAIKLVHPHLLSDEQTVQRFYTEARAASRLNHPNSVSVIDFGRTDDGILYLVMEFLEGDDLAHILAQRGPIPIDRVVDLMGQMLDALEEAHHLGIVHRDIKPENVLVLRSRTGQERVKVLDFGLATVVGATGSVTRPGLVCGTPAYMSPEQAKGEVVDARSDLYSLGAMLFELLTDRPPYDAETPMKMLLRHVHDPVPDPRAYAPQREIPAALAVTTMRSLAKEPGERFQSAAEFRKALIGARSAGPTTGPISSSTTARPRVCVSCGELNEATMRYCGSCGARLPGFTTGSPKKSAAPPARTIRTLALVGREAELAALDALRAEAEQRPMLARLDGEPGSGRTRLLEELHARATNAGDSVVVVGRHDSGVPVAYAAATSLVRDLLGGQPNASLVESLGTARVGPIARAGFEELDNPSGLRGIEGASRVAAVGAAVAWSVRRAIERVAPARLLVLVDEADRLDALSREALGRGISELEEDPVLFVTVGALPNVAKFEPSVVRLGALDLATARAAFGEEGDDVDPSFSILPRVLAQLAALGETIEDFRNRSKRPNAADLAVSRLDRLDLSARRVLQTLAVLGRRAAIADVKKLAEVPSNEPLADLVTRGFVFTEGWNIAFVDPFLAELVAMSTPAEARRLLHAAALDLCVDSGAPSDVIAEHAWLANDGMRSLVFLERCGDASLRQGNVASAAAIFRRGAEIARAESLESGESMFDAARVTFTRKLGEALALQGQHVAADGILREVIDLPEIDRVARGRALLSAAYVSRLRGRTEEATKQLFACLELIAGENAQVEAGVQFELGELRMASGNLPQAITAFRRCVELLSGSDGDRIIVARAFARLADIAVAMGETEAVMPALTLVAEESGRAGAPAIAARAFARCADHAGEFADVARARALELSTAAGDAETFREVASRAAAA